MTADPPLFGRPEPGRDYWRRPGVYGIAMEGDAIAIVEVDGLWYLPGGGIEAGEDPEEALAREFLEETGLTVVIGELLWEADEYTWSSLEGHFVKAGRYHRVRVDPTTPTVEPVEADHTLRWVPTSEAAARLTHEAQRLLVTRHARDPADRPTG